MTIGDIVEEYEPADGWYKSETKEKLEKSVKIMRDNGVGIRDIYKVLELIISSMMSEYGE